MGDLAVPERPDGRHAAVRDRAGAPAMPVVRPGEQVPAVPYPLLDGLSPTIGWQFRSQAKGGPAFGGCPGLRRTLRVAVPRLEPAEW